MVVVEASDDCGEGKRCLRKGAGDGCGGGKQWLW